MPHIFCHSERSEESLFLFMLLNRREIPRFARNDKIDYFFRSLLESNFEFDMANLLEIRKARPRRLVCSQKNMAGRGIPAMLFARGKKPLRVPVTRCASGAGCARCPRNSSDTPGCARRRKSS